jgi:uncharacterized LabA/DUF88 family protein
MACNSTHKLAVLIDADNAQYSRIGLLLSEIAKYGTAHVKRAYGDWTDHRLEGWNNELLHLSIQPKQQVAYTQGKNATDSAMIIDAMDLLHSSHFDGFCLISSDSDFTPLATRVRESGLKVYGFGEHKTPEAFVAACDKFFYTEDLIHDSRIVSHSNGAMKPEPNTFGQQAKENGHCDIQKQDTTENFLDNRGWAALSDVREHLTAQHPDFDVSTLGYSNLNELLFESPDFDIERRLSQADRTPEFYVRKQKSPHGSM